MVLNEGSLTATLNALAAESTEFLCAMMRIPSVRGNEDPVKRMVTEPMRKLRTSTELMQIPGSFTDDPLQLAAARTHV
jgi:hypothetical protein